MMAKKLLYIASIITLSIIIGVTQACAQWVPLDTSQFYPSPLSAPWAFPVMGPYLLDGNYYRSTDTGKTWTQDSVANPLGGNTNCFTEIGSIIYGGNGLVSGGDLGIIYSTDSGAAWDWLTDIVPYDNFTGYQNGINALTTVDSNLIAGTDSGVFISTDSDWVRSNTGLGTDSLCIDAFLWVGSTLFGGSNGNNGGAAIGGVFRSTDSGVSWGHISSSNLANAGSIYTLAWNGQTMYAGTEAGVYLSTDNGSTWNTANNGLPTMNFDLFAYSFAFVGPDVLVATNAGIFLSRDNGATWTDFNQGVQGPDIGATSIAIYGQYLFAGLGNDEPDGPSVWRRPLSDLGISGVAESAAPNSDSNLCVFPNPATNSITVESANGPISILDPLGRRYVVPQSGNTLDISTLPAGVYFVSDGHSEVKYVKE
jgi:photosystem II stability/assembly factor-like uncharacterized protein